MTIEQIIELGLSKGISKIQVVSSTTGGLNITVYKGQVEECKKSLVEKFGVRGVYRGKMGYVAFEDSSEENVSYLLDELIANAKSVTSKEPAILFKGAKKYRSVPEKPSNLSSVPLAKKIEKVVELDTLLKNSKNILQVEGTVYSESVGKTRFVNSLGLNLTEEHSYGLVYSTGVFSKDESDIQTFTDFATFINFEELDVTKIAERISKGGNKKLGGYTPNSGLYDCVFSQECVGEFFSVFNDNFSAEAKYRNLTKFSDKVNTKVASEKLTVIDDPYCTKSLFQSPFDGEGVPTKTKKLIENGVFKGFLNSLKYAKLLKEKVTGNGPSCDPFVLVVKPGKVSFANLVKDIKDGIYICELAGLHAGVHSTSGDFSVQASGFEIKDGKVGKPVKMIVVSGNFFECINNIVEIGSDAKFFVLSDTYTPSIHFGKMAIGGK
ncbi:MAG: TldD/PmbA family protein [Acholeplasmatales bacterium]|jgi:PmbA protein|nr:TldD/PmbA family protein [Acholeplasmatales bacterium]